MALTAHIISVQVKYALQERRGYYAGKNGQVVELLIASILLLIDREVMMEE